MKKLILSLAISFFLAGLNLSAKAQIKPECDCSRFVIDQTPPQNQTRFFDWSGPVPLGMNGFDRELWYYQRTDEEKQGYQLVVCQTPENPNQWEYASFSKVGSFSGCDHPYSYLKGLEFTSKGVFALSELCQYSCTEYPAFSSSYSILRFPFFRRKFDCGNMVPEAVEIWEGDSFPDLSEKIKGRKILSSERIQNAMLSRQNDTLKWEPFPSDFYIWPAKKRGFLKRSPKIKEIWVLFKEKETENYRGTHAGLLIYKVQEDELEFRVVDNYWGGWLVRVMNGAFNSFIPKE